MAKTVISVDITKPPTKQPTPLHNRWHPDIPPVVTVKPGEDFIVEALDWTGGQIKNDDNASDIRDCYLPPCHHLVGPIEVTGAEPGDILVVDMLHYSVLAGERTM
jgi:formamidase